MENSLKLASDKHGEPKLMEAYKAFVEHVQRTRDQATYDKIMASPDPGEALVEWHEQGAQAPQEAPQDAYQAALEQGRRDCISRNPGKAGKSRQEATKRKRLARKGVVLELRALNPVIRLLM
jgi:hypothetical protein